MAEDDRSASVLRARTWEITIPHEFQHGGVDDKSADSCTQEVIHRMLDERFIQNRHQWLGQDGSERRETCTESCTQDKGLMHDGEEKLACSPRSAANSADD